MTSPASVLLPNPRLTDNISRIEQAQAPFAGALWYEARTVDDGLVYDFTPGALADCHWVTCDLLTDQDTDFVFNLEFYEPDSTQPFMCRFSLLSNTQARFRLNLEALQLNRWRYNREGGLLKPTIDGWPVALERVNRIFLKVLYKAPGNARWCMTPLRATVEEPPMLTDPVILNAPLLDAMGQATFRDWPGKTQDEATLAARLREQLAEASAQALPEAFSRWGGWKNRRVEATGFFRTHHDGKRWWLVDPDGHLFWSAGVDCVRHQIESNIRNLHHALTSLPPRESEFAECFTPFHGSQDENEPFDYLIANFIRTFGVESWRSRWTEIAQSLLRRIGFNSYGNWSECAEASAAEIPYVYPMPALPASKQRVARIFRDFPDVFDPAFEAEGADFAQPLAATANDPSMIGYFLMNEPEWGFALIIAAEGMMRNTPVCATRRVFAEELRQKYADPAALVEAWGEGVTFEEIAQGAWTKSFTAAAHADMLAFSTRMVRKLYDTLNAACRRVAPNHLNLGARFAFAPEEWIANGITSFDVFSINCYRLEADEKLGALCERLNVPALIGEWHFGAIDAGLPAPGIGHAWDQKERGAAYRFFVERSAARPWCVGAHWFTLYDQSALGRSDGENYNIGFVDVCHRLYAPLVEAARATHEQLYDVASGTVPPINKEPKIQARLNL